VENAPKPHLDQASRQAFGSPNEIFDVLNRVRDSLATMFIAAGTNPSRTRPTATHLELDRSYIWPVTKIVNTEDILSIAKDIPSLKRIEVICEACRQKGATDSEVDAVRNAVIRLERLIEISAGDRESFGDLLQGLTYDDVTSRQEEARRMTYRGNSSLWGVRARVNFKTVIHSPSEVKDGWIDTVRLGGLVGLQRYRPVPWSLYRMHAYSDDGTPWEVTTRPLDPTITDPMGLPVLREFCTDPLPEILDVDTDFGKRFDLAPGLIGNVGAVDCVFADQMRPFISLHNDDGNEDLSAMIDLQTPSEMLIFDLFLHRDLGLTEIPEIMHLDRLNSARGYRTKGDELSHLPISSTIKLLSPGTASCATPAYPDYHRLLDHTFEMIEQPPLDFRGYRFMMKYPTIPSAIVLRLKKPTRSSR